jgi:hypothetical protein
MVIRMAGLVVTVDEEEIVVRFARAAYPEEGAAVEEAQTRVARAVRVDDPRVQAEAANAMYESVLALLAAPAGGRKRARRRW